MPPAAPYPVSLLPAPPRLKNTPGPGGPAGISRLVSRLIARASCRSSSGLGVSVSFDCPTGAEGAVIHAMLTTTSHCDGLSLPFWVYSFLRTSLSPLTVGTGINNTHSDRTAMPLRFTVAFRGLTLGLALCFYVVPDSIEQKDRS